MPGSSANVNNSSFIPKRGPTRRRNPRGKKQVFIFSIITYSLLFASLLAAAATFLYQNYLQTQLQTEVTELNNVMNSFSVEDLSVVSELDTTLKRANNRLEHAVSIVSIFDGIDTATVGPVQIESLNIERDGDDQFILSGSILASSFDAAIFQRKVYNSNQRLFSRVAVSDVNVDETSSVGVGSSGAESEKVTFAVELTVPLEEVLYDPAEARLLDGSAPAAPVVVPEPDDNAGADDGNIDTENNI